MVSGIGSRKHDFPMDWLLSDGKENSTFMILIIFTYKVGILNDKFGASRK